MSRLKYTLAGIGGLLVLAAFSMGATFLTRAMGEDSAAAVPVPAAETEEEALSMSPTQITDAYLVFEDRLLARYHYDEKSIAYTAGAIMEAFSAVPAHVRKHLMIVPPRIAVEPEFSGYTDDVAAAIDELHKKIAGADEHSLLDALYGRRAEHIYLRYGEYWTALGAYYAAELFLNELGIPAIPLERYEQSQTSSYVYTPEGVPPLRETAEELPYYLLPGGVNWQTVTTRVSSGVYETHESPVIALSRQSERTFIGRNYSHAVLEGDAENGETLLIIGDDYARFFAPWLTPYYENVLLLNMNYYNGRPGDFALLFKQYDIRQLILLEGVSSMGNSPANNRLVRFTTGG